MGLYIRWAGWGMLSGFLIQQALVCVRYWRMLVPLSRCRLETAALVTLVTASPLQEHSIRVEIFGCSYVRGVLASRTFWT
jgi:hypothetical protein